MTHLSRHLPLRTYFTKDLRRSYLVLYGSTWRPHNVRECFATFTMLMVATFLLRGYNCFVLRWAVL